MEVAEQRDIENVVRMYMYVRCEIIEGVVLFLLLLRVFLFIILFRGMVFFFFFFWKFIYTFSKNFLLNIHKSENFCFLCLRENKHDTEGDGGRK